MKKLLAAKPMKTVMSILMLVIFVFGMVIVPAMADPEYDEVPAIEAEEPMDAASEPEMDVESYTEAPYDQDQEMNAPMEENEVPMDEEPVYDQEQDIEEMPAE